YARDADRPLTPEGKRKLKRVAEAMQKLDLSFDLLLSSPYLRARQTAELVAEALGQKKKLEFADSLKPDGSFRNLIDYLKNWKSRSVLLVGHEPHLSGLISFLLSGRPNLSITLKKVGLCRLAVDKLNYGQCATIEWLLTPSQM